MKKEMAVVRKEKEDLEKSSKHEELNGQVLKFENDMELRLKRLAEERNQAQAEELETKALLKKAESTL